MLAAVFGPGPPRYSRKERIEGAAIEVRAERERRWWAMGIGGGCDSMDGGTQWCKT